MADLFKDMLSAEESLFANEMALDFDYLPKELPHRENQQHYIADCIKLLLAGRMGKNLLITGAPGIGKTAAVKWVLREMEEKGLDEKAIPLYVNCWKKDTPHKILLDICGQLGYKWVQNRNTDELFKEVANVLNKKSAIIVLDEVDKLESEQVIYQLIEDIYRKCIILITNDIEWIGDVDARLKSRLVPETIDFKQYNLAETNDILKRRIKSAFAPNVWEEKAIDIVSEKVFGAGDMRYGLFLLREAGNIAEKKSSRKVKQEHAESAVEKLSDFSIRKEHELDEEEKNVLALVKENQGKTSTELYDIYKKNSNKSYRTFHRKLKSLEEAGIVEIEGDFTAATGGRVSRVRIK
ncbi:MAG: AAA family ATPase [Nanoarchaeota archaeon]|nr:AAA family ATPase [Nanoarchaeota archaeon]